MEPDFEKQYHELMNTKREDDRFHLITSKLIPNYKNYENKAFELIKKYGILTALKKVSQPTPEKGK